MLVIVASEYMHKLKNSIGFSLPAYQWVEKDAFLEMSMACSSHRLLVDEDILSSDVDFLDRFEEVLILTHRDENQLTGKIKYITKYQNVKLIMQLIQQGKNGLVLMSNLSGLKPKTELHTCVANAFKCEYWLSLDLHEPSDFSLYTYMHNPKMKLNKFYTHNLMTNISDYFNPPTESILNLIEMLQNTGDVLVESTYLKSTLDFQLIEKSRLIVLFCDDASILFSRRVQTQFPQKRFIVIRLDAYTEFTNEIYGSKITAELALGATL